MMDIDFSIIKREISLKREDAGEPHMRFPANIMKKFIQKLSYERFVYISISDDIFSIRRRNEENVLIK